MDSGNSGSMSSSCGDDQEHVLNSFHPTTQFGGSSDHNNNSDPNLISQYQSSTPFDLSSNYLQPFSQNLRSDQVPSLTTVTRSDHQQQQQPNCTNNNLPGSSSSAALPVKPTNLIRKTKKRTRVSRRAPTTILNTDTSNFRAMVQEFTGIPAPPFSAGLTSSSSYSRRFDSIFGGSAGPHYPIRPSAQKVQSSSSSLLMSNSTPSTNFGASSTSNDMNMNNFTFNHQGLIPHHQSMMLNMQSPILSAFQSSSSSLPHHHEQQQQPTPFHSTSSFFGAKPNFEFTTLPLRSSEEQLGMPMSHGHDDDDMRWRDQGGFGSAAGGGDGRGVVVLEHHGGHHLMRPNLDHHGMG